MKSLQAHGFGWVSGLLLIAALSLAACAPDPTGLIISPQLGEQMAALEAGNEIVVAEPTEAPKLADLAPEAVTAGLPDDIAMVLGAADPASGEQLALARGCVGCHALDPATTMTGPTWYHIGDTAVSRVAGESPAFYLYHSIVNPNLFIVPNYPSNIMPANYSEQLSTQELADLIAYLLQQNETEGG